ncbi:MAG: 4Fe-4S binding protein, partial [Candidatus Sumerlaeia bacterium]|nr:4Fe-4S binding protein [Candidatus Sumerlaeia bacterium]
MVNKTLIRNKFRQVINRELCRRCKLCVLECGFEALSFENDVRAVADKCVACHRCENICPEGAITIQRADIVSRYHNYWTPRVIEEIYCQAETGGIILTSMGNEREYKSYFDHIVID